MSFFFHTLQSIFAAFTLLIKGDDKANEHIEISDAHWLLSWLMAIAACFIYLTFLPDVFSIAINQKTLPSETLYDAFRSANMISLISVFLIGYLVVFLLERPLQYAGSVRRYIILQNWVFLVYILFIAPISPAIATLDAESPLVTVLLSIFIFVLFFTYRIIKIVLQISGLKAFLLLVVLLTLELLIDNTIDGWFGLNIEVG